MKTLITLYDGSQWLVEYDGEMRQVDAVLVRYPSHIPLDEVARLHARELRLRLAERRERAA